MAADQEYVPQQMTTSSTVVSNNTATYSGRKFKRSISWSDSESNLRKLRNGDFNNCDLLEKFLTKRRHCHLQSVGNSDAEVDSDVNAETESVREDPPEFRLSSSSDADDEVSTRPSTETCPTEPMENKKQIKPGRKLLKTNSVFSDEVFMPDNKRTLTFQQKKILVGPLKDKLFVGLSGLYGIALVVLGFVLPIAETFSDPTKPYFFEIFYLYLYITSILFLIYVYVYLLRRNRMTFNILSRTWSFRRSVNSCKDSPNASTTSFRTRKRKVAFDETNNHHTGSFYLRLGALAFGVGSMIHSGLNFGHYFEIHHHGDPCSDLVQAIKPVFHLIFTFAQLYFVFQNSKMCIHRYRSLARFGLMHMSGTNICVWVRGIVVETLQVIRKSERQQLAQQLAKHPIYDSNNNSITDPALINDEARYDLLPELACHWDALMGRIVDKASDYLYPCTIEYSLICAAILYIMWRNVGYGRSPRREKSVSDDEYDGESVRTTRMSVDCTGSSRGLFLGILMFVVGVVSLVAFYVLVTQDHLRTAATLLGHLSETFMYLVSMVAVCFAAHRMKDLHYSRKRGGLEQTLIIFALFGLFIFGMFSIVAAMFFISTLDGVLTIITNLCMITQASMQAVFMMVALKMSAVNVLHVRRKDGREYVTFLLISNFALWAINTFETQRSEHNPLQLAFYGPKAWSIFSHISVPLGIFYRFHSTVCLSIIWKNAWKYK